MRIVIAGGCRTGKTTFAKEAGLTIGVRPMCTDDLVGLGWSQASEHASYWLDLPGPWIVEGVAAVRALRKWLERTPSKTAKPCDVLYWLTRAQVPLKAGQDSMNKGCETVWREIKDRLEERGVVVHYGF